VDVGGDVDRDETLDVLGLYCPAPILHTGKKLAEMETGQVLEVLSDDEGIKKDMPAWCESTGNEFLGLEEQGDQIRVYVRKTT
jgi:tRNA 2-thiouridine synthesizing protein A